MHGYVGGAESWLMYSVEGYSDGRGPDPVKKSTSGFVQRYKSERYLQPKTKCDTL